MAGLTWQGGERVPHFAIGGDTGRGGKLRGEGFKAGGVSLSLRGAV